MTEFRGELPNHFILPEQIERLAELVYNLWWVWEKEAQRLFTLIDEHLWEKSYHNPIMFFRQVERKKLNAVTSDRYYMEFYEKTIKRFDAYMAAEQTWFNQSHPDLVNSPIAYFSTEFGLHETLPIYAGGLGVLSGDTLKEASDLGLPMVALGFLYTQGYFSQHITEDGWQEARQVDLKFEDLPVIPLFDDSGQRLRISVELPGREVSAQLWEIQVGRIPLYLLDTNVAENNESDRFLTARLYSSDLDLRISQEIILGIGGVRALRILGYNPAVWHMNEGHSAFLSFERIREMVAAGHEFEAALEKVKDGNIFTTHTPVPAGNDEFPLWLMDKYFSRLWPELGLEREQFINLAHRTLTWGETFSMPVLALRMSAQRNGVSELHGQVARRMWNFLWPDMSENDVPIDHITNGVHTGTWLARRFKTLYDQFFPQDWWQRVDDPEVWQYVMTIPDEQLWEVRKHLKRRLAAYMRERARDQWQHCQMHPIQVVASGVLLDPYALTIGFARRFATYKRAGLILQDFDRLLQLLNQPNMPVQIIFAGKAHPADQPGKLLIQEVYRKVKLAENGGRIIFLEDYDMNLGRCLTQGVDVWLNTPRRPNEASGTSGQKAALNGVLNFSVMDGWWREGYNGKNGWAIGEDRDYQDPAEQDRDDLAALYNILENEIIPLYYDQRSPDKLPVKWVAMVKECIRTLGPCFSMRRMMKEYNQKLYLQAMKENGRV